MEEKTRRVLDGDGDLLVRGRGGSIKWSLFPEQSLEGIPAFYQLELGCLFYKIYCFHATLKFCNIIITFMFISAFA